MRLIILFLILVNIMSAQSIQFENLCDDGSIDTYVVIWEKDIEQTKTYFILNSLEKKSFDVTVDTWYCVVFYNRDSCGEELHGGKYIEGNLKIENPYKDGLRKYYINDTMYWKPLTGQKFFKINDYCWDYYKT